MDKTFVEEMKEKLLAEQKSLREQLGKFADPTAAPDDFAARFPSYGEEQDENAQEVATYQDRLSIETNLEQTLQGVDKALAKIENGMYGTCENCGKEIPKERLHAFPAASLCTDCASKK